MPATRELLLIKNGEIALKGLNRAVFEDRLVKNLRRRLTTLGRVEIVKAQSTIMATPLEDAFDMEQAVERVRRVFGIAQFSRARVVEKSMEAIFAAAPDYLRETLDAVSTFKVEAKRADKAFPLTSPQICEQVGGVLLDHFGHLRVDVHHPDVTVYVEIRDFGAYIHAGTIPGAGGLPAGCGGRAAVLISGGIDSPVAAYMMAKRGLELHAVHFASPPYTSERAREKVLDLLRIVSSYSGTVVCHVVPFTRIQEEIRRHMPEELFTLVMRRQMMRLAGRIAQKEGCRALITGESIGQVASQTLEAIVCTEAAAPIPVLRPLVGMDKEEIVAIARRIGTFETSILPYEDCCTVFTPKHPRTRPDLKLLEQTESAFDFEPLLAQAEEGTERLIIR